MASSTIKRPATTWQFDIADISFAKGDYGIYYANEINNSKHIIGLINFNYLLLDAGLSPSTNPTGAHYCKIFKVESNGTLAQVTDDSVTLRCVLMY